MAIAPRAARVSIAAAVTFVALLAVLHPLKPDLDPSWRMISEYALGDWGFLMVAAFLALATSCVALFVAIRGEARGIAGRIALALLLVTALGLVLAAVFPTDPATAKEAERTTHGRVHEMGATFDAISIVALLLIWSLGSKNPAWRFARPWLVAAAVVAWLGEAWFLTALSSMPKGGGLGPDVHLGWPGRLLIVIHAVWLMTVAWCALRAARLERERLGLGSTEAALAA